MTELETIPKAPRDVPAMNGAVNILLVDDDGRNLDVLESILCSPDRQLIRAQTAEETLMALLRQDFAAIVLDIQMPGMSGFELARLIKQRKRNRHIPIIFLTAYFHEDKDVLSGYDLGAVDYLTKPVNPDILKSKVNAFAELFRTTRALALANDSLQEEIARRQEAEDALRHANAELEARVEGRTADLLRANRELRESEHRYRLILENALEYAILTLDKNGLITSWNAGIQRVLGFEEPEILGRSLEVIYTPEDRKNGHWPATMKRALLVGRVHEENWRVRKDRSRFWASGLLMALKDEEGASLGFLEILRDRTAHKLAEQQLREAEILRASERERLRISQDLHDGLGQQLAGISCLCDGLGHDLAKDGSPHSTAASKISRLLDNAVAQARSLARGLQPVAPEPNGLMSALDHMAASVCDLFKVPCHFHCPRQVLVEDNAVATHLYRIAQEAATNAIKHGHPRQITIGLWCSPRKTVLSVQDDGVGLPDAAPKSKGMGLRIMEGRATLIGGTLLIRSKNRGGVEVVCAIRTTAPRKTGNVL